MHVNIFFSLRNDYHRQLLRTMFFVSSTVAFICTATFKTAETVVSLFTIFWNACCFCGDVGEITSINRLITLLSKSFIFLSIEKLGFTFVSISRSVRSPLYHLESFILGTGVMTLHCSSSKFSFLSRKKVNAPLFLSGLRCAVSLIFAKDIFFRLFHEESV